MTQPRIWSPICKSGCSWLLICTPLICLAVTARHTFVSSPIPNILTNKPYIYSVVCIVFLLTRAFCWLINNVKGKEPMQCVHDGLPLAAHESRHCNRAHTDTSSALPLCVCLLLCLMATGSHLHFPHCLLTQSKPGNHVLINLNVNTHWLHRRCRCTGNFARLPALTPCPLPSTPTTHPGALHALQLAHAFPLDCQCHAPPPPRCRPWLAALPRHLQLLLLQARLGKLPPRRHVGPVCCSVIPSTQSLLSSSRSVATALPSAQVWLCVCVGVVYGCAFVHNRACVWMHLP